MATMKRTARLPGSRKSNKRMQTMVDGTMEQRGESLSMQEEHPSEGQQEPQERSVAGFDTEQSEGQKQDAVDATEQSSAAKASSTSRSDATGRKSRKKTAPMGEVDLTPGQLVGIKRRERGWSQTELGWATGISRSQVGWIERDECDPKVSSIESLEAILDIPLYDRFMEFRRKKVKGKPRPENDQREDSGVVRDFCKDLARLGIKGSCLKDFLIETLKAADERRSEGSLEAFEHHPNDHDSQNPFSKDEDHETEPASDAGQKLDRDAPDGGSARRNRKKI